MSRYKTMTVTGVGDKGAQLGIAPIFQSINIPAVVLDANGDVIVWSDSLSALLEVSREDVENADRIGAVVHDGERQLILAEKVLEHPESADDVYDVKRVTGATVVETDGYPTYEDTSTVTGGSNADIRFTATPLVHRGEVVGVLEVVQRNDPDDCSETDRIIAELSETLTAFEQGTFTSQFGDSVDKPSVTDDRPAHVTDLARIRDALHQQVLETEAAKRRLKRRNTQLEQFSSMVAHDLRNPLSVARSHLSALEDDRDSDCDRETVAVVREAHERMESLIDDLLELARAGDVINETTTIRLEALAWKCWNGVETKEATLSVETDHVVEADKCRLQQLLENLLRNAVEHGDKSVTVRIGSLPAGFYVADDGNGIDSGESEQVFESGYSTSADGTGFGLAIVTEIAEAHGWEVTVTESTDGGARFEVTGVTVHR